ncbi:MAG: hypothetical protein AAB666_02285, partial [Patescibacteria group bacterium]
SQVRAQLSSSLLGIVSQRLVPRIKGGMIPACEIMMSNSATANLIRENKVAQIESVIQTSAKEGMVSLQNNIQELVKEGLITEEVAKKRLGGGTKRRYV